jgi:hypothetical protein
MIIRSQVPQLWPHLGFSLDAGINEIDESQIPLAAHGKLMHYQKSRVITGYTPSAEFIAEAEKHQRMMKPPKPAATLRAMEAEAAKTKAGAR